MNKIALVLAAGLLSACTGAPPPPPPPDAPAPGAGAAAPAEVALIPREALFGNPSRALGRISPDGRWLAYVAPRDGVLNVYIAPADQPDAARPITNDRLRGVRNYSFAFDGKHLLYAQDTGGDENFRLHAVDLDTGEDRVLTPEGARAGIAGLSPDHPGVVVATLNDRDPTYFDLVRIDLASGASERIVENTRFAGFTLDSDLQPRLATLSKDDGSGVVHRWQDGEWTPWIEVPQADSLTTGAAGYSRDGSILYMIDSRERDTSALVAIDTASGTPTVLHADPRADVNDVMADPATGKAQAVAVNHLRDTWTVLDPAIADDLAYLDTLGEGEIDVVSRTQDDQHWIVEQVTAENGVRVYRYDRAAKTASLWFETRPELAGHTLAPMRPVEIAARDGLNLVSYLTVPVQAGADAQGKPPTPLPMVLLVHGGPWARDSYGFNGTHQWLANRGYAVLSVNFRGSTGFGKAFTNAGDLKWGTAMHEDLIDAVTWAVDQGIADPKRVAIMGGSYGGYATLAGLTFTPDTFACGVDIVGPSNLITLLESIPPYWGPLRSQFTTRMGNPDTEEGRAMLVERSPLTHVDKISKPLLIGQGANDPRVKQAESDQIVEAMQARGIPVTYVLYPDEGHGFARPPNRLSFNAITESFLGRCLGGRVEPIGTAFEGATLTVPAGAEFLPGLPEALAARD
jgi:dipeptidyl aminopeptidase/acylaminoacyl peptidase